MHARSSSLLSKRVYSSPYSAAMFNFFGGGEPKPQQSAGAQWSQTVKDEESAAKRRGKVRQRASAVAARNGHVREAERKRERHGWFEWRKERAGVTGTERERESARVGVAAVERQIQHNTEREIG